MITTGAPSGALFKVMTMNYKTECCDNLIKDKNVQTYIDNGMYCPSCGRNADLMAEDEYYAREEVNFFIEEYSKGNNLFDY